MDIKRAKEEIKNTVKAYLETDENGRPLIPEMRQRPILLIGPPGIGKTAIIEQAARECSIGVAAYNMTHHTRQSAMGLPFISQKEFAGQSYQVTEYTMSEIIASVHEKIEKTGLKHGILFIDEINCVSETLAPIMLQFLQAKTFGNAKVPSGWIIVAAGNPAEYNRSVREFDVVTLDRVKKIEINADYPVWKEYAGKQRIHQAVLSYLDARQENFYRIETTVDGKQFVTARGWEDLSDFIKAYEKIGLMVDEQVVSEYIQQPEIAIDFTNYLALYYKYEKTYSMEAILTGNTPESVKDRIRQAAFDERVSVVSLMLGSLNASFIESFRYDGFVTALFEQLKYFQRQSEGEDAARAFEQIVKEYHEQYEQKKSAGLFSSEEEKIALKVSQKLNAWLILIKERGFYKKEAAFEALRNEFTQLTEQREQLLIRTGDRLEKGFDFVEEMFEQGPELVLFVTELSANFYSLNFIQENGCDRFYQYNKSMLRDTRRQQLTQQIDSTLSQ